MVKIIDSDTTNMYQKGRESGYISGYEDGFNTKIEQLFIYPNEVIVLFFNIERNTCEEIEDLLRLLQKRFTDNKVIALPNTVNLESCNKNMLENIIGMISKVIEKM